MQHSKHWILGANFEAFEAGWSFYKFLGHSTIKPTRDEMMTFVIKRYF